jgi:2-polyprenyl-3-methyl-5-hydroxy-6-metoxy-1,4-benzoquinol methylase
MRVLDAGMPLFFHYQETLEMSDDVAVISRDRVKMDEQAVLKYANRKPGKHAAEMALVERSMPELPAGACVLDAPCGAGRLSLWMVQQGWQVSAIDMGAAAVDFTRQLLIDNGFSVEVKEGDIFSMPWERRAFKLVVCFRLIHHFSDARVREKLLRELARVSDQHLLISYLSPWSYTGVKRWLKYRLTGHSSRQNHTTLRELKSMLEPLGFILAKDVAQRRLFHALHMAYFVRVNNR